MGNNDKGVCPLCEKKGVLLSSGPHQFHMPDGRGIDTIVACCEECLPNATKYLLASGATIVGEVMKPVTTVDEMMKQAEAIMNELVEHLATLTWRSLEVPPQDNAVAYQGMGDGWIITVASWTRMIDKEEMRGYDGACVKGMTIVHLTRDVAEQVFLHAEKTRNADGSSSKG